MSGHVFTLGSLFSGIGGLELGLEMTGRFQTVWQVEQSEYCRKVLARHWPNAQRFVDVREVGKENLPAVDVICGGFPCQDISYAGNGAGLDGARSGLWYEFARIIREMEPEYVVVENVAALFTRGLDAVLGTLADSGYDAQWSRLSAADVGAPHLRERVFIVAYASRDERGRRAAIRRTRERVVASGSRFGRIEHQRQVTQARSDADRSGLEGRNDEVVPKRPGQRTSRESGSSVADSRRDGRHRREEQNQLPVAGREQSSSRRHNADRRAGGILGPDARNTAGRQKQSSQWLVEPDVGRVANGVPARMDRLTALGNAVVPQCARVIGEWLLEIDAELSAEGAA